MRRAVLHALASSTDSQVPFLTVLVLPVWEDTPWNAASIRGHPNMTTLVCIPAGHFRFVPAHQRTDADTPAVSPARWPVELVLISNEEGRNHFLDHHRIDTVLGHCSLGPKPNNPYRTETNWTKSSRKSRTGTVRSTRNEQKVFDP